MSEEILKKAIAGKKMRCPKCAQPVQQYDKFVDAIQNIWDGFGDSRIDVSGSKVTLICGNDKCDWRERTEYWLNYVED